MPENGFTVTVPLEQYSKLIESHTRLVIINQYIENTETAYLDKKEFMKIFE